MDSYRTTLFILAIRGIAAVGLLIVGIYNLATGDTALGVLWIALAVVFAYMAYRRVRAVQSDDERRPPPGHEP